MKLREVFRTSKRLYMLVLLTMAAAIPAIATTTCQEITGTCPDGRSWGVYVCCVSGSPYAECYCSSWSRSGGYSNCGVTAGCA